MPLGVQSNGPRFEKTAAPPRAEPAAKSLAPDALKIDAPKLEQLAPRPLAEPDAPRTGLAAPYTSLSVRDDEVARLVDSASTSARVSVATVLSTLSNLESKRPSTLKLADLSKARSRLEATLGSLETAAKLLPERGVELTPSFVRLAASLEKLETVADRIAANGDQLAGRVTGSPGAVKRELGDIAKLSDQLGALKEQLLQVRTHPPEGCTVWTPSTKGGTAALLTHPIDGNDKFDVYRLPNLNPKERIVEAEFANSFKLRGQRMVHEFLKMVRSGAFGASNVIEPDTAKLLSPRFSRPDLAQRIREDQASIAEAKQRLAGGDASAKSTIDLAESDIAAAKKELAKSRAESNIPLHMTATAIARLALIQALDDLAKDSSIPAGQKTLLVTCGGVAAGKGTSLQKAGETVKEVKTASLVYDTDGESSGVFNQHVLEECQKRGIKPIFMYVHADPVSAWDRVFGRAAQVGRMVSEEPFLDSHVDSPKNFAAFHAAHKSDRLPDGSPAAEFIVIDNSKGGAPTLIDQVPGEALVYNRQELRDVIRKKTDTAEVPTVFSDVARRSRDIWGQRAEP